MHPPPEASSRTNRNQSHKGQTLNPGLVASAAGMALLTAAAASAQVTVTIRRVSVSPLEASTDLYRFAELPSISAVTGDPAALLIAYATNANEMIPSDPNTDHGQMDVYRTRMVLGSGGPSHTWASQNTSMDPGFGSSFPSISDDGARIAFQSTGDAFNFSIAGVTDSGFQQNRSAMDVYLWDAATGISPVSVNADGTAMASGSSPAISGNGDFVVFASGAGTAFGIPPTEAGDTDIFRYDVTGGSTQLVSPGSDEGDGTPAASFDGRFVAFASETAKGSDFGGGAEPGVNTDPNNTSATDLGADIFLADMNDPLAPIIRGVSVTDADGRITGNDVSRLPAISETGAFVAFVSLASDLDAQTTDENSSPDVYCRSCPLVSTPEGTSDSRDCLLGQTWLVSVGDAGAAPSEASGANWTRPAIYENTETGIVAIAFSSLAPLTADDNDPIDDPKWDLFVRVMSQRDPACGQTYLVSRADGGGSANYASFSPAITGITDNGQTTLFIAFASWATDMTDETDPDEAPDENDAKDIFLAELTVPTPTCQ